MYAISAQIVAYLIDAGFPPLQAATAWGFSGIVLLFGMLGVTQLDAIIGRRPSVLFSYAISIVGIVCSCCCSTIRATGCSIAFVVTFGSMIGSRGPLITATAMKIFRGERVGTIFGTISIGSGLGSGLGSWAGGLIHDWTHSYNPVIVFALVAVVLGIDPVPGGAGAEAVGRPDWASRENRGPQLFGGNSIGVLFCLPVLNSKILRSTPGAIAEIGLTRSTGWPGVPTTS